MGLVPGGTEEHGGLDLHLAVAPQRVRPGNRVFRPAGSGEPGGRIESMA